MKALKSILISFSVAFLILVCTIIFLMLIKGQINGNNWKEIDLKEIVNLHMVVITFLFIIPAFPSIISRSVKNTINKSKKNEIEKSLTNGSN